MLPAGWLRLVAALCSLLLGQAQAPSPGVPPERSRPYAVLRGQNLGERRGPGLERGGAGCAFADRAELGELVPALGSGRAGGREARELVPDRWSSGARFSCCQPPALGAGALALCAGVTCWHLKLETWVCALMSGSMDPG